ncbi:oxygenase MpaB family protein [Nocardioides sp.]|uniref:oxygenase MpaB family protein n=1 Tax=Nocardioides sp. TaxID=35761 RepID=UPI0035275E10
MLEPPRTEAALAADLAAFRPELRAVPAAHEALRHLRHEAPLPLPGRPAYAALWLAAIDLLPAWARAELRLRDHPWLARRAGHAATRAVRWALTPGQRRTRRLEQVTGVWES